MYFVQKSASYLARACNGNPILTTLTIILFMVLFNLLEATVEKLIFGHRFEHWIDVILQILFICYAAYAVFACAIYNSNKRA